MNLYVRRLEKEGRERILNQLDKKEKILKKVNFMEWDSKLIYLGLKKTNQVINFNNKTM